MEQNLVNLRPSLTPLILAVLFAGCSTVSYSSDFDTSVDFAKLTTYDWIPQSETSQVETLDAQRIRSAVDRELSRKGLRVVAENPDFVVVFQLSTRTRTDVRDWSSPHRYGWYYDDRRIEVRQYEEGTLVVEMYDPRSKKMIWSGRATAALSSTPPPPAEREKRINEVVQGILDAFPPKT
jgi:hypothetical protein